MYAQEHGQDLSRAGGGDFSDEIQIAEQETGNERRNERKEVELMHSRKEKQMDTKKNLSQMAAVLFLVSIFLSLGAAVLPVVPASAAEKQEAEQLVEKARLTMESFMLESTMGAFRDLLKKSHGVMIVPDLLKGAFVVGVSGGNAVFLARDQKSGQWSNPAFYTIGGASFGLQIGGQASEVILLVMTERGISSLLGNSLKLGGDVGVAAGPVGIGVAASTANLSADILSFSRSRGLYGGVSLEGAVVAVRSGLNDAFYGRKTSPTDILIHREVRNEMALRLMENVKKSAAENKG